MLSSHFLLKDLGARNIFLLLSYLDHLKFVTTQILFIVRLLCIWQYLFKCTTVNKGVMSLQLYHGLLLSSCFFLVGFFLSTCFCGNIYVLTISFLLWPFCFGNYFRNPLSPFQVSSCFGIWRSHVFIRK